MYLNNSKNFFERTLYSYMKISNNQELFCQKYWHTILKKKITNPQISRFDIADANLNLMGLDSKHLSTSELQALIKHSDIALKVLAKPIKNDITLWRGVPKPDKSPKYVKNLFKISKKLKKGDNFHIPQYSFWTTNPQIALKYANQNGLIYELKISKGTNILEKIFPILQRASKFLCTQNTKIKENNLKLNHIKLQLLPRETKL